MTLLYVDVSHHDRARRAAALDWQAIKSVTSPVMCARATYGDPNGFSPDTFFFAEFQQGARAAGFTLRGAYHNLVRGDVSSMRRQVDWFRSELDACNCAWAMLDIERYKELVERDLWPRWEDVLRFRDAWHAVEGRPLAYYLPQWLYNSYYGGADLRELPGPLVQSHYAGGDGTAAQVYANAGGDSGTGWDDAYGGRLPDIWQYTSDGNVPGASDHTDVNAFRGSVDELAALLTGGDMGAIEWIDPRIEALTHGMDTVRFGPEAGSPVETVQLLKRVDTNVTALKSVIEQLAEVIKAGGGSVDTAAILRGVDERLATQRAAIEDDTRDAVADAAEGGAKQVREDAGS